MKFKAALLRKQAELGKIITRRQLHKMVHRDNKDLKCSLAWIEGLSKPSVKAKPSEKVRKALEKTLGVPIEF